MREDSMITELMTLVETLMPHVVISNGPMYGQPKPSVRRCEPGIYSVVTGDKATLWTLFQGGKHA